MMYRIFLFLVLAILPVSLISQYSKFDYPSEPLKLATLESFNPDTWKYNQRKVARMPGPVVIFESNDTIYCSTDLGITWIKFRGKDASLVGGSYDGYIVYRTEEFTLFEDKTIVESEIMLYNIRTGSKSTLSVPLSDDSQRYSFPMADMDSFGMLHGIYGITDTTSNGDQYIKSLMYTNFGLTYQCLYDLEDPSNLDTVINYAIATNLVFSGPDCVSIAYQLSNDSIYLRNSIGGRELDTIHAFQGVEPSISIGCGWYRGELIDDYTFVEVMHLDKKRNIRSFGFRVYGFYFKKGVLGQSNEMSLQSSYIESACIDDIVMPFGYSYIFQKEKTLYHAFSWEYPNSGVLDTVAHNVIASSIAYKEFNTEKVDIVWLEEVAGKYVLYYQAFEKVPFFTSISEDTGEELISAYPNPFSSRITFRISSDILTVTIYSMEGRVMKTLNNLKDSGTMEYSWDGKTENGIQVSPGTYVVKFSTERDSYFRKIIYLD